MGYKLHVTETCGAKADAPQLVVHVAVHVAPTPACVADAAALAPIQAHLTDRHLLPAGRSGIGSVGMAFGILFPASATSPHKRNECRERNQVERLINRLKRFRRVATRYEKRAAHYLAMVILAAALVWLARSMRCDKRSATNAKGTSRCGQAPL
jgi:hypothetical protein